MVFPVVGQGSGVQGFAGPPGLLRAQGAADVFLALLAALLGEGQWPNGTQQVVGDQDAASMRAPLQDKHEVDGETAALAGALAVLGATPGWPTAPSRLQVEPSAAVPQETEGDVTHGVPVVGQMAAHQPVMLSVSTAGDQLTKASSPEPAGEQLLSGASTVGQLAAGREHPQVQSQVSQASVREGLAISDLTAVQTTLASDAASTRAVVGEIEEVLGAVAVEQQAPTKGLLTARVRAVGTGESVAAADHFGTDVESAGSRDRGQGAAEGTELVGSLSLATRGGVEQATLHTTEPGGWVEPIVQVEERVLQALERGVRQVRVRLEPPELGVVDVRVREIGGRLEVTLAAEYPEVRQALEQGRNGLRMALAAGGFSVQRLEIQPLTGSSGQDLLGGTPSGSGWSGGQQGAAGDPGWARENAKVSHLVPREVSEAERPRSFQPASLIDTWA